MTTAVAPKGFLSLALMWTTWANTTTVLESRQFVKYGHGHGMGPLGLESARILTGQGSTRGMPVGKITKPLSSL
ncbi:hypothetical protein N7481_008280 [Penicillium waksmanii]|uniref:uncharacterized protein n=1 Tax=Penicillium waksmanii TaxID=69791 RepID=UPI002549736C|nr:uncharacterized protein N7481_008280 [Penicillium waksmanii]KAJ5980982.1 hypothetical protein N7481_008280 [Penicillium waksmanii]